MSDPTVTPTPTPCPTCSPPVRETVGMVCQTCGTDYAPAPSAPDLDAIRAEAASLTEDPEFEQSLHIGGMEQDLARFVLDRVPALLAALAAAHAERDVARRNSQRWLAERDAAHAETEQYRRNEVTLTNELSRARQDAAEFCGQRDEARAALAARPAPHPLDRLCNDPAPTLNLPGAMPVPPPVYCARTKGHEPPHAHGQMTWAARPAPVVSGEAVEAGGRALYEVEGEGCEPIDNIGWQREREPVRDEYRRKARAVLLAALGITVAAAPAADDEGGQA